MQSSWRTEHEFQFVNWGGAPECSNKFQGEPDASFLGVSLDNQVVRLLLLSSTNGIASVECVLDIVQRCFAYISWSFAAMILVHSSRKMVEGHTAQQMAKLMLPCYFSQMNGFILWFHVFRTYPYYLLASLTYPHFL